MPEKRDTILIVDDQEVNRAILRAAFEGEYNILEAENGNMALYLIDQYHKKIAATLLDIIMPGKNGYEVLKECGSKGYLNDFPVVVITAEDSTDNKVQAFDLGASDIIAKPFELYVVKRRVQNIIDLNLQRQNQESIINEQAEKFRESNASMIDALSSIIEYRSLETGQHVKRIRLFTRALIEDVAHSYPEYMLTEKQINVITSASSMHDIGKIAIPDSILNKPGRLTPEEFTIMKTHTTKGCEMIARLEKIGDKEFLSYAYNIARYHHERWDGKGYPDGLKGDSIPICAQVVSVADVYDALTNDRVYKKAIPPKDAIVMILNGECGQFSPKILESLKNVEAVFASFTAQYSDNSDKFVDSFKDMKSPNLPTAPSIEPLDTLQMGQMKYFALLKYNQATTAEIDFASGMYHLVYMASDDFAELKSRPSFNEAMRSFVEVSVKPEDRTEALKITSGEVEKMFAEGLTTWKSKYKIFSKSSNEYVDYTCTVLRINLDSPTQRKALIIWRPTKLQDKPLIDLDNPNANTRLFNQILDAVQPVRNDSNFTIEEPNQSFLKLTGFSAQELKERFNNKFFLLIAPDDRDRIIKELRDQIHSSSLVELEYRLLTKENGYIWVLDKSAPFTGPNGTDYFYSMLMNTTRTKKAEEELRLLTERYRLIMEQTNDVVFEWDAAKDTMTFSDNCESKLGFKPISKDFSKQIMLGSHVNPNDIPLLKQSTMSIRSGMPYHEIEIRIADANGRYRWYKVRIAVQIDSTGKIIKAVGTLSDIDDERRAKDLLQSKADRDSLTMLLNKMTSRAEIEKYIAESKGKKKAALFILDIDEFKSVNDHYGHMFGDVVLQEMASEIQKLFSTEDVVSRIGGDEYLILMKDIADRKQVLQRAIDLNTNIAEDIIKKNMDGLKISCSIGVSVFPDDGEDYKTLFEHADMALYASKAGGKDVAMFYEKDKTEEIFRNVRNQLPLRTNIDSENPIQDSSDSIISDVFETLYEGNGSENAVYDVLKTVGTRFGVSRVMIFEDQEDDAYCKNTYEWCNQGIEPEKANLQRLGLIQDGSDIRKVFDDEGVYCCNDINAAPSWVYKLLQPQGVKSCLMSEMVEGCKVRGFIGFNDASTTRVWTKEQKDTLILIARIMTVFIMKNRQKEKTESEFANIMKLVNSQTVPIAIIAADTHEILFTNKQFVEHVSSIGFGVCCHQTWYGLLRPCSECPLQTATKEGFGDTVEKISPSNGSFFQTKAIQLKWEDRDAYLVTYAIINNKK
jgi:diguanylate cyclase (GGDEF)-like protein/PAS domain S-box-containing protein